MRISRETVLAAVFAFAFPLALCAQSTPATVLETGKWTGIVMPPNGETVEVTYDVATKNDGSQTMVINAGPHGTFAVAKMTIESGKLSFYFTPGPEVRCALSRKDDGSYEGDCMDDGGAPAHMTMLPPKKEAAGS